MKLVTYRSKTLWIAIIALARSASEVAAIAPNINAAAQFYKQPVKYDLIITSKEYNILKRSIPTSIRT